MEDNELLELLVKIDGVINETIKINQYIKYAFQFENTQDGIEVVALGCDEKSAMTSFVVKGTRLSGCSKGVFSIKKVGHKTSCQINYFIEEDNTNVS